MDNFQNAIKQARNESWNILEKAYNEIKNKNDKLLEYIYLHLIKTIPFSKIKIGPSWSNGIVKQDKRYLEIEKEITIFIEIEDQMSNYYKKEDDIEILKAEDKLYISGHIVNTQILCYDSIKIDELSLEGLTNRIDYIIKRLKEKQNNSK